MSVGFLKRSLTLLNLVAVLAIVGPAYGFWSHRGVLEATPQAVEFTPEVSAVSRESVSSISHVTMKLGRFREAVAPTEKPTEKPTEEKIESVLQRLGDIKGAVVVYPPYGKLRPSIIFEFKDGRKEKIVTIQLGEGLEERPHSSPKLRFYGFTEPARYKFVGCEPDPENPGWTYFLFDMKCDGTDVQKARWKGEQGPDDASTSQPTVGPKEDPLFYRGNLEKDGRETPKPRPAPAGPGQPPVTAPVPVTQPGTIFESEGDVVRPTRDGVRYLRENYDKILQEASTTTYRDASGKARGVQVRGIKPGSVANEFGIRKDDVILAINNRPVTKQAQAVNIVKAELRKKPTPRYLDVRILRNGVEMTKRFDTRDPDTRAKAKDALER